MSRSEQLDAAAQTFHEANPKVWVLFVHFTYALILAGRTRSGVSAIWERIRWESAIDRNSEELKLNNNHRAFYARKFMEQHPDYASFFETRESDSQFRPARLYAAK